MTPTRATPESASTCPTEPVGRDSSPDGACPSEHGAQAPRKLHPELPLFLIEAGGRAALYAPGHLLPLTPADASQCRAGDLDAIPAAARGVELAAGALDRWHSLASAPYRPECLTLYLSNACNAACRYCFAAGSGAAARESGPWLDPAVARAAAETVARHCADAGKPLRVVVQGGGEPTVHGELLERVLRETREAAAAHGTGWWGYLATNGLVDDARLAWLAQNLDAVGLSCDGPPDIQDRQRPNAAGEPTAALVARAARRLIDSGVDLAVRATITPETVSRQPEIVEYLHDALGARAIRFEPVYLRGGLAGGFTPEMAAGFVGGFLAAEQRARELGGELSYAGVRLDGIHGPHCSLLKHVLHVLPEGSVSACFAQVGGGAPLERRRIIGRRAGFGGMNEARVEALRRRATAVPDRCVDCVAQLHCARDCPDVCSAVGDLPAEPGFRCRVNRDLCERWLAQATEGLAAQPRTAPRSRVSASRLPSWADTEGVRAQFERALTGSGVNRRALPQPPWAVGYTDEGARAWEMARCLAGRAGPGAPLSVYVHVPYCDRRCGFCDCLAEPLPRARREATETRFLGALEAELADWAQASGLERRPVTTVHFGGGTPACLSPSAFEGLVQAVGSRLGVSAESEWALETTASRSDPAQLDRLIALGFRRLHVGVQTLEEPLRQRLGRREPAVVVLERLAQAVERGLVVSVDLIYGLPGEDPARFLEGLGDLAAVGIQGFSLYQLQRTTRNLAFLDRLGHGPPRDPKAECLLFLAADERLAHLGYCRNHFTHWARTEDRNLYYRHRLRGEDLLALGPTADGRFGDYVYRHVGARDYVQARDMGARLEGGLRLSAREARLADLTAELMGAKVNRAALRDAGLGAVLEQWIESGIVFPDDDGEAYRLSAAGSWGLVDLIEQIADGTATACERRKQADALGTAPSRSKP